MKIFLTICMVAGTTAARPRAGLRELGVKMASRFAVHQAAAALNRQQAGSVSTLSIMASED